MPTTNPVPSQDPSDLLFNAGKLDEVLNGTGNSFTDRLGVARRTVAGMNADFDAQLADAESDLNVYRADAAASAAQALGYLNTILTTSYGAYASDPATDPLGNPPNVGDEYFNTTSNLLKRFNGTTWQASDINTANMAASSGSSLVGHDTGTVQDVLDAVTGPNGAASVGYTPAGTGAVATTVRSKLRDSVSVTDKGADKTGASDSFADFNASPDNSFVPAGTYNLSASVIGKTFFSFGDVTLTGAGSANIVNVVEDFNGAFTAVDAGTYPSTSLEYKSEPSLVATSSGRVFCFYRIGPGHQGNTGETGYLVYRIYNKLTNTWSATQTLVGRAGWDSRNQIAGVTPTGRIIVAYHQCEYTGPGVINSATRVTKYKYSDDDGITWSSEFSLSQYCPYPSLNNVPFGSIISFANGNLLITLYNYHTIFTLKSTDNGTTWGTTSASLPNPNANITTVYTTPVASDDNITEPCLVKVSENNLVCIARCIATGLVSDGTVTWQYLGKKWLSSTRYEEGMHVYISGRVYLCAAAGTSGTIAPSHTSGSAVDGTVTWLHAGGYSQWTQNTAYSTTGQAGKPECVETYSAYLYRCKVSGTTGSSAPFYSKLAGEEPQIAYFKSDNGGASWGSAQYVTWTNNLYRTTNSPPKAIVRGDTIDVAWFSRSPEWSLYRVRMSARGFFENPSWAFSKTDGEPRIRVMRSFVAPASNAFDLRIDVGYVEMVYLPWTDKLMAAWYDSPYLSSVKTTIYSTIVEP